jgi:hypothetical protein
MHNDLSRLRLYLPLFAMLLLRTTLSKMHFVMPPGRQRRMVPNDH